MLRSHLYVAILLKIIFLSVVLSIGFLDDQIEVFENDSLVEICVGASYPVDFNLTLEYEEFLARGKGGGRGTEGGRVRVKGGGEEVSMKERIISK